MQLGDQREQLGRPGSLQSARPLGKAKSSSLHSNQETKPGDCVASSRSSENLEPILSELRLRREEVDRLRNKLENVKVREAKPVPEGL